MFNAQSAKVYLSEVPIIMCEVNGSNFFRKLRSMIIRFNTRFEKKNESELGGIYIFI